ncbi:24435_t:CDS:2, partial [Gigaspora rosea]
MFYSENMQSEASLQISSNPIQALSSDITQNVEQDLRDELTMDNPFSKQNPDKLILTNSEDIVMDTIENEAEFTT